MKQIFKIILLALILAYTPALFAQTATPPAGTGTAGDPYQIATMENLYWLTTHPESWTNQFIQTADLNASSTSSWNSGSGLNPIGNSPYFSGTYNGQSHTISGLYINRSGTNVIGLFGEITSTGIVKNIVLLNATVRGYEFTGGLAGINQGNILNCGISGSVTGNNWVGGIVGSNNYGTTNASYSSASVTGSQVVGGLIGENWYGTANNCYATGSVSGSSYIAGLAGNNYVATITNSYATGLITTSSTKYGLVGYTSAATCTNSFWDTQTTGTNTSNGGTGKTTAEMKTQSTFTDAGWNFTTIWLMNSGINNGYPYLSANAPPIPLLTWDGSAGSAWEEASNWTPEIVPTAGYNVVIPDVTNDPTVNQAPGTPAVCNTLTVNSGAVLTIAAGKALTVNGTLTNNAGNAGLAVQSGGSLIESATGVAATVNCTIPASQWHFISAPISDATSLIFLNKYLQTHSESSNEYTDITPTTGELTPMKGFAVWGDAGGFTASYTGMLNAGELSYSTSYSGASKGWNLAGNPYPSSIDWDAATGWTKTNVNNAIYIHVDASKFATYVGGAATNGGTRYIAPGQGFFVRASAAGSLAMTNAVRVHNATTFFKKSGEVIPNLVRLEVSGNNYKDEAVVRFLPEATAEFDGNYDAYKLYGGVAEAAQIYTVGSTELAINSLPVTNIIPVGLKAGVSGTYTIGATEINNLQYVALEDTKTGIFTELAKSGYTFNFETGENEQRFNLHFSALGIADNQQETANIYSFQKTVYVNLNNQSKGDIFIYNISGQLVASVASAQGLNSIYLANSGNYIVKVITLKKTVVSKVFVK